MGSCSNSSNIRSASTVVNVSNDGGNRISVQIPLANLQTPGVCAGEAIYYDVGTSKYTRSKADNANTAEIFGVVESVDISGNASVVMAGSIGLTGFFNLSAGGCGGHDIYFLSGTTAGKLQSLPPSTPGHIVKAIYQRAPHGAYTGIITNYIGYKIPTP
jgi:hypothetical protein